MCWPGAAPLGADGAREEHRVEDERYSGAHAQTISLDSNRCVTDRSYLYMVALWQWFEVQVTEGNIGDI